MTSPTPPLSNMPKEKSSIDGTSPVGSQRSEKRDNVPSTPRKSNKNEDIVNADSISLRQTQTSGLSTPCNPRPSKRSQAASIVVNIYPQGGQTGAHADCDKMRSSLFTIIKKSRTRSKSDSRTTTQHPEHNNHLPTTRSRSVRGLTRGWPPP